MLETVLDIPFWLELVATIFCAIGGAMAAVRAHYDIFGVTCLAIITGLAGGMVRDLFLQDYGIYAFQQPTLIVAAAIMGLVVFYLGKLVTYFDPITDFVECMATALFVVLGTGKALSAGQEFVPAIILGLMTAIGGGIVRDICMARPPQTFQAGPLYTTAALMGAIVFAAMKQFPYVEAHAAITGVILVIVLRYAALYFNWQTSTAHDQSGRVARIITKPVVKAAQAARPPKGKLAREKSLSTYGKIAARLQTWVAKLESDETTSTTAKASDPSLTLEIPSCCGACSEGHRIHVQESDCILVNRRDFLAYLDCIYAKRGRRQNLR